VTANRIKDYFKYGGTARSYTMDELFSDGLKLKIQSKSKINTIKKYQVLPKLFYKYTELTGENDAREVKNKDILNFITKAGNDYKQSSLNRLLKMLKFYFNYAFANGKIPSNPFAGVKIKKPQEEQVFLTYDEIKKIRDLKITNDKMDRVRDIFLFMCFTGLEYADLANLNKDDVERQGNQMYIKKRRIKTGGRESGEEYISVLYEDAIDIWEAYEGNLPLISNQKLNMYLKQLAKDAEIDKNITTLTARHTYATYLLSVKMLPEAVVQKMLGHTNSTQTRHYAKMLDNSVLEANLATEQPTVKKVSKVSEYKETEDDIEAFNKLLGI
jgi:site-specific recombinase XerD